MQKTVELTITMPDLLDDYRAEMERLSRAEGSLASFDKAARKWRGYLDGRDPATATRADVSAFLGSCGLAPSTQKVTRAWLRAAYEMAVDLEVVDRNPCRRVRVPPIPQTIPRVLSLDTLAALEGNCRDAHDVLFLRMMTHTGMRASEALAVTVNDLNLSAGTIRVDGKGHRERIVPVHPRLRAAILDAGLPSPWLIRSAAGGQLTLGGSWDRLEKIRRGLNVQRHDFRRTFATELHRAGVDGDVVRQILGHSRRDVHARYFHVDAKTMAAAVLRLPY